MVRYLTIASSLLATLLIAGAIILLAPGGRPPGGNGRPAMPSEPEEIEENPAGREQMELMQLRDPATGAIPEGIRRAELAFARTLPQRDRAGLAKRSGAAFDWRGRGPANVGGRTRALALDAGDPDIILAGGITGGMWRSEDRGLSWRSTTAPDQLPSVTCVAQDRRPAKRNVWYYGTGEFRSNSNRFGGVQWHGNGIFKSTDGARSWSPLPSTLNATPQTLDNPFEYVNTIVTDPSNATEDEVYAACFGAIMRSTDGGGSWRAVLGKEGNPVGYTTVAITPGGVLYAGIGSGGIDAGIWRSTDGVSWHNIAPNDWADSCRRIVLAIAPSDPNTVYVLAQTPFSGITIQGSYGYPEHYSFWRYRYLSGDGSGNGGSWANRSLNLPLPGGQLNYNGLDSYTMALAVAPDNPERIYLGGTNLYKSDDALATTGSAEWLGGYGGTSPVWELHPDQHAIVIDPTTSTLYIGNDGGVFSTPVPDGAAPAWTALNNGYLTTQFYAIAIDAGTPGSDLIAGGLQDNGTIVTDQADAGFPWWSAFGGDGCICEIVDGGKVMYVSSQGGNIFKMRLDDQGVPDEYIHIQPADASGYLFVAPFAMDRTTNSILYLAAGGTLWRNSNVNEIPFDDTYPTTMVNWAPLTGTALNRPISAVSSSTESPRHRVYYGTIDGRVYRLDRADMDDPTPVDVTGPGFPKGAYVNCVAVDPADGNRALAVFTNYNVQSLFLTTDAGATWTPVGGNLEEHPDGTGSGPSCRWAALVHRGSEITAFVGTTTGLYSTRALDGMATVWEQEGASTIGYVRVDMIAARGADGYVAAGTWGKGAFSTMLPPLGVEQERVAAATRMLGEPYPNPASGPATIPFTIPGNTGRRARIALFDVRGKELATIAEGTFAPGGHEARLDPATLPGRLPAGAYYYRIECGGATETRRITLQ